MQVTEYRSAAQIISKTSDKYKKKKKFKFKYKPKSYLKHQTSDQPKLTGLGPRLTDSSTPDKTTLPIQTFKGKFKIPKIDGSVQTTTV